MQLHGSTLRSRSGAIAGAAAGLLVMMSPSAFADVIHVDADAAPFGDGTSWERAFRYLNDALAVAVADDEIHVAQGTYQPDLSDGDAEPLDRTETFQLIDGVLRSWAGTPVLAKQTDARDVDDFKTILTGDLLGNDLPDFGNYDDNSYHVVTGSGTGPTALLDGFTIESGNAEDATPPGGGGMDITTGSPSVRQCTFEVNLAKFGAGVWSSDGTPRLESCRFEANRAVGPDPLSGQGGGLYAINSDLVIVDTDFVRNEVVGSAGMLTGGGGGMHVQNGSLTISGSTFEENVATGVGLFSGFAAGLSIIAPQLTMIDCAFVGNRAVGEHTDSGYGAAFYHTWSLAGTASAYIANCRSLDNYGESADGGSGGFAAGGGVARKVVATVVNSVFSGNGGSPIASGFGVGGTADPAPIVTMVNSTITENREGDPGGGLTIADDISATVFLRNTIVWGNAPEEIYVGNMATLDVQFCDVQGGWTGRGNIDLDPAFVDPSGADYRLAAGSPCIDAGHDNAVPSDSADLDADTDHAERTPDDLDHNPRFADDRDTADTGCGSPAVVDMGAFEHEGVPEHPVLIGDIDADGVVGFDDLLEVLSAWGPCDDYCCMADVDFTQEVGFDDLLLVLSNWS